MEVSWMEIIFHRRTLLGLSWDAHEASTMRLPSMESHETRNYHKNFTRVSLKSHGHERLMETLSIFNAQHWKTLIVVVVV